MKKLVLFFTAAIALCSCGNSAKSTSAESDRVATDSVVNPLVQAWVQPIPGLEGEQGINIKADGSAESINMNTLVFKAWELTNDSTLTLVSESIGNKTSSMDTTAWSIVKLTNDSLIIQNGEIIESYGAKK